MADRLHVLVGKRGRATSLVNCADRGINHVLIMPLTSDRTGYAGQSVVSLTLSHFAALRRFIRLRLDDAMLSERLGKRDRQFGNREAEILRRVCPAVWMLALG